MRSLLKFIPLFLFITIFSNAATVGVIAKYGKTGGIVGPLNQAGDKVNGIDICPSDPTAGCDFSQDPGYSANGTVDDGSDDTYNGDLLIRTNDAFEVIAGVRWNGDSTKDNGKITATLPTKDGKQYFEWTDLPGLCIGDLSSISTDQQVLICVVNNFDKNEVGTIAMDIPLVVRVRGGAPEGVEPGDIVIKVEADEATPKEDSVGTSLKVTAAPHWNIQKGHYTYYTGETDPDDSNIKGWIIDYTFNIETDEVNGEIDTASSILGNESLGKSANVSFIDDISLVAPHAKLHSCSFKGRLKNKDGYNGGSKVISYSGAGSIHANLTEQHIAQDLASRQITCTQNGSAINVSLTGVDLSLDKYPTKSYNGSNLPVNRAVGTVGNIRIFVPLDDVQKGADGQLGTADDGYLKTHNHITNFDPNTASGNSNFGGAIESDKDNHDYITLYYSAGGWDKYYRGTHNGQNGDYGVWAYIGAGYRSGDGMVGKGSEFTTVLDTTNYGGTSFTEDTLCDVFDAYRIELRPTSENTVYTDIKTRYTGSSDLPYRYMIEYDSGNYTDTNGVAGNPYIVEYATTYVDDSFLPSKGGDTNADVRQKIKTECTDPNIQWTTDYSAARMASPIGVTKVRMRLKNGVEHPPAAYVYFWLNYVIREKDLATNAPFNNGDLFVNYAAHKFSGQNWTLPSYKPGLFPGNHSGGAGDRLIYTGAKARIVKSESMTAAAPGMEIEYTLKTSFTNETGAEDHGELKIIDVLPYDFHYVSGSSLEYGEPQLGNCAMAQDLASDTAVTCEDGKNEVLVWDLGTRTVNENIKDMQYKALIGIGAKVGVNTNAVKVESPLDGSDITQRKSLIGVNITIPSTINIVKSTIENPAYSPREKTSDPKDILFAINLRNGSSNSVTNLDVIDILPFVGDGNKVINFTDIKVNRKKPTAFHGTQKFNGVQIAQNPASTAACALNDVKYYYTNIAPETINMAPSITDENKLNNAKSIWCEGTQAGPNGCTITSSGFTFSDNSQVTAIRVKDQSINFESQAICTLGLKLQVKNNLGGDVYSNSAGASAEGVTLPVLSNSPAATVIYSSLGDKVWFDENHDGIQDGNENGIAGVKVKLLDAAGNPVKNPVNPVENYEVVTDTNGNYKFTFLNHGDYKVEFEIPSGYATSPKNSSGNSAVDSNIGPAANVTDLISLGADEENLNIDAGLYRLTISGNIFDDGDGDSNVNGSAISSPDGQQLYVTLVGNDGKVLAVKAVGVDGKYRFVGSDGVVANSHYTVVLSTLQGVVGQPKPLVELPNNWNNTGEHINATKGNDGAVNSEITVPVTTDNVPLVDFGINKKPIAQDLTKDSALNPGGSIRVAVTTLPISDHEDGTPKIVTITQLPNNATLYYNGQPVVAGTPITNFDPALLTVDPIDGDQTVVFPYTTTDAAGIVSDPATVTMPFTGLGISGTLFNDGNGDGNVNGTPVKSAGDVPLFVNLIDAQGNVVASTPLGDDGAYIFTGQDGVTANTSYVLALSSTRGVSGQIAPVVVLPEGWDHADGENINSVLNTGNDGLKNGLISVLLNVVGVGQVDFSINERPTAKDNSAPVRVNPSGDTRYSTPDLNVTDREDGIPTIITIETIPDPLTGILYYNGVPVVAGQRIDHFNQSLLTVDPVDTNPTMVFTYSATDASGAVSEVAIVTIPFRGDIFVGNRVWMDNNGNNIQDTGDSGIAGVVVNLYNKDGILVSTATTDSNGEYRIKVENPGDYYLEFPSKYSYVTKDAGTDDIDSDVDSLTFRTETFSLAYGDTDMTYDAGVTSTAHIGDYFWIDENMNGIQTENEQPIIGATVELFDMQGNPANDAHGNHAVITDANGRYGFDVNPGTYQVRFTIPKNLIKDGYAFVDAGKGNGNNDSNVTINGFTQVVTVDAGDNILALDAGVNCGCANVSSDSSDSLSLFGMIIMMLTTLFAPLFFARKEEELVA